MLEKIPVIAHAITRPFSQ